MKFKDLRDKLFFEREDIIINKKVTVRGQEILFLGFIKGDKCNRLYALCKNHCIGDEYEEGLITNRQDKINSVKASRINSSIFLKEMMIQNQKVTFKSFSGSSLEYYDNLDTEDLKHLIKNGAISEEWDDIDITNIFITCYEQADGEDFPQIDANEKITITLKIDEDSEEILIEHPITVTLGDYPLNTRIDYVDEYNNKDFFYINEVGRYDLWEDTLKNLDNIMNDIEEDEREQFKEEHLTSTEYLCPKGMDLLTISYETKDGSQLRFLSKKHLESMIEYNSHGVAMLIGIDDEDKYGKNNYLKSVDFLDPIERDFNGNIEVELFSKQIKIPGEIVSFEI